MSFLALSAPKSQRFFEICDCDAHRRPQKSQRFPRQEKAMLHSDLRVRWKVASDLRFRAAISEPKTPSFCGSSGDLAPSTRKSLASAIARFWCAKPWGLQKNVLLGELCFRNDLLSRGMSFQRLSVRDTLFESLPTLQAPEESKPSIRQDTAKDTI